MANDYAAMQARIADELFGRTDLTTQIQTAIQSALTFWQRRKFFFNEGIDTSITTVSGTQSYAVPSGFQGNDSLTITYSNYPYPMDKITWDQFRIYAINAAQSPSVPECWAYYADQIWLYPTPNGAYLLSLAETKNLGALSAGSDTNAWMVEGEELIRGRAKADVLINILHDQAATAERAGLAMAGEYFYSIAEQIAYCSLMGISTMKMSSGRLRPTPGF